jgi:hypothetical protein
MDVYEETGDGFHCTQYSVCGWLFYAAKKTATALTFKMVAVRRVSQLLFIQYATLVKVFHNWHSNLMCLGNQ